MNPSITVLHAFKKVKITIKIEKYTAASFNLVSSVFGSVNNLLFLPGYTYLGVNWFVYLGCPHIECLEKLCYILHVSHNTSRQVWAYSHSIDGRTRDGKRRKKIMWVHFKLASCLVTSNLST